MSWDHPSLPYELVNPPAVILNYHRRYRTQPYVKNSAVCAVSRWFCGICAAAAKILRQYFEISKYKNLITFQCVLEVPLPDLPILQGNRREAPVTRFASPSNLDVLPDKPRLRASLLLHEATVISAKLAAITLVLVLC